MLKCIIEFVIFKRTDREHKRTSASINNLLFATSTRSAECVIEQQQLEIVTAEERWYRARFKRRAAEWLKVAQGEVASFSGHNDLSASGQVDASGRQTDGCTEDHEDFDEESYA